MTEINERLHWQERGGKRIYVEDYSGLTGDELLQVLHDSEEDFKKLTSPVLLLVDFTGAHADQDFFDELKRLGKEYDAFIEKSANVGVTGFKKVLAVAYHAFTGQSDRTRYFDSREDAIDFLLK